MVVLSSILNLHLFGRSPHRSAMARVRLPLLPQGTGVFSERSQAERTEGGAGQAGVRGDVYDRGQGLGRGAHFGTDYYWPDSGESETLNNSTPNGL